MKYKVFNICIPVGMIGLSFLILSFDKLSKKPINQETNPSSKNLSLMGNRFFTFATVVRVNQIETGRNETHGVDESTVHNPESARYFRESVEKNWPGARMTWAFSWLALHDQRQNYKDLRKLIVSYHHTYGDEITFIPGGFFANMYNTRKQVNQDIHDG
ncbi:MAG: DUF3863 domain-containing protein, partial [Saprospiraceae bacterium]|nr:DUF3863 domain-containing protein [Saprospiraceae bacterium]